MQGRISDLAYAIILFFLSTVCSAQGVWELQNPIPTNEELNDIYCLPGSTITWAVGSNGTVLKTYDGNTWTKLNSGTNLYLQSVFFFDTNTGWSVASDGTIIKTTNGGSKWTVQTSGTTQPLRVVQFLSKDEGYAVGSYTYENKSVFLKTINGGETWTVNIIAGYQIVSMFFINSNVGWASGWNGAILKTSDGGINWIPQTIGTTSDLRSIYFINATTGWVVGRKGVVFKTADGGTNWVAQTSNNTGLFYSVYMVNANVGWIVGESGTILTTTNGGTSWIPQSNSSITSLNSVCFTNTNYGFAVGMSGRILKTIDGGTNWVLQTSGISLYLRDVQFYDANIGWAVGDNNAYALGIVLKTLNGGVTWTTQISNYARGFYSIDFIDANTGWVVGASGTILKTIDGGTNWSSQTSNTSETLKSVCFKNSSTGWAVGTRRTILKTTNGGTTWTVLTTGTSAYDLKSVFFIDQNNGWAVGDIILKTTNGGTSWTQQFPDSNFWDVYFTNLNTGWVIGGYGLIKKTVDSGVTWTNQSTTDTFGFGDSGDLSFTDSNTGRAVGGSGVIIKTSDGGNTWTTESSNTSQILKGVFFVNANNGWAVGFGGTIIHYTNYCPTTQASSLISSGNTFQNVNISWTRGNGNQCVLFAKQANTGTCIPDVNVTYLPNATFGLGDQIGSTGWFCVNNGMGTSASISGLQANTSYRFQVCEYNYSPDFTHYNSTTATNNPITVTTAIAPPQITTNPGNITLCETLNTNFSVTASGSDLNYQWQVDAGSGYLNVTNGGVYSGSTSSTLSLTGIPGNLNANKYHCVVSNTSGSTTSNEAVLIVNPLPVNPADVSGNQVVCMNSSYLYTVPPVQYSASYIWTFPTGFSGNSSINNITLATASNAISGNITVKGINACGSGPVKSFPVSVRKLPGNSSQITGLNSVCTGSINVGYSTVTISDADYYVWSLPFEATGGSITNSIMVNYGSNPLTGQITVKGHNICGDGPQSVLPVSVNTVPAAIGTITGRSNVCKNEKNVLYAINPIPNASSYIWTLPTGLTGSNSTNSVSLNIGPEAFSGDLKVSGVNSCGSGTPIVFPILVDAVPDAPGPISGPSNVCRGTSNIQYTVAKSERAYSYTWELPDGTSETTVVNKIALNFDNNAISGYLSVTPNNSCGEGNISTAFLEVSVPTKPEIDSGNYRGGTCMANTPLRLSVKQPMQGYNYLWYKYGKLYNDANSTFLEDFLTSGDYTVEANLNGCKVQSDVFNVYYPGAPAKPSIFIHGPKVWYLACSNDKARDYKWYYNGDLIAGADKYIYVPNQKLGNYYVTISNEAGCYTSSDVVKIPVDALGVDETDPFAGLTIYPNPNSGQFTLKTQNKIFGEITISVLDQRGNEIFRSKFEKTSEQFSSQINLKTQSKGIYIVNLSINGLTSERKIIIE